MLFITAVQGGIRSSYDPDAQDAYPHRRNRHRRRRLFPCMQQLIDLRHVRYIGWRTHRSGKVRAEPMYG